MNSAKNGPKVNVTAYALSKTRNTDTILLEELNWYHQYGQ